jgi:hypothetical protein
MGRGYDISVIDTEFTKAGLEPLDPFITPAAERRCRCVHCGTLRWVRLRVIRRGGIACRWCHGWDTCNRLEARLRAGWRGTQYGTPTDSLTRLRMLNLAPLTEVGDLYRPVGVVCLTCGETFVTIPERIGGERVYWGCQRCSAVRTHAVLAAAERVFREHGLELLTPCRGEYAPQRVRCMTCGVERLVSLDDLKRGSAALCWTCTHGIRPDEPHRVYLFHFPSLRVMKVGLTHDRHDRRFFQHIAEGGELVDSVVVPDRDSARRLEQLLKARYRLWLTTDIGPQDFPQGGWTEAWSDSAPVPDLAAEARAALCMID